jgi:hypothetical protein
VPSGSGASAGATETCTIGATNLMAGHTYAFELEVTDSASTPETRTSAPSPTVTVSSPLTKPGKPVVSQTAIETDQSLTVTGRLPTSGSAPYSWEWLISMNGHSFGEATQCTQPTGSGGSAGEQVSCSIPANTLAAGHYRFELRVTDGAHPAETATSKESVEVKVRTHHTPALPAGPAEVLSSLMYNANALSTVRALPAVSTAARPLTGGFLSTAN